MMTDNGEEYLIPENIDDTVQCLKFFPSKDINYLASGGWDKKLRLFEIKYQIFSQQYSHDCVQINSNLLIENLHQSHILSLAWKGNSGAIITGCTDGSINYIDMQKNIMNKMGQHKAGCKEVLYNDNYNLVMSGGWDGALNLWDLRAQNPVCTYQFFNKIYTMSYSNNLLVVGMSELVMAYFNLDYLKSQQFQPEIMFNSHLKEQTRKVAVFNEGNGFMQGSIEGRVAVKYIPNLYGMPAFNKENNIIYTEKDFAFKCHRCIKNNIVQVYPINDISINPTYGCVCTAGGDGKYCIWDIGDRSRLYEKKNCEDNCPLTACDFNKAGNLLAFASGYDWSKGMNYAQYYSRPKIFIHYLQKSQRKK
jgi:mRNA export factor